MKVFLVYIVLSVATGIDIKVNTSIPPFYSLNECKHYVNVNSMNIINSARTAFKGKKILEMGCVEIHEGGSRFLPNYKEDTSI